MYAGGLTTCSEQNLAKLNDLLHPARRENRTHFLPKLKQPVRQILILLGIRMHGTYEVNTVRPINQPLFTTAESGLSKLNFSRRPVKLDLLELLHRLKNSTRSYFSGYPKTVLTFSRNLLLSLLDILLIA